MQVSSYMFQNPYPQPIQVGRADPAMVKEQNEKSEEKLDQQRQNATALLGAKSKHDQAEIYIKSSAMYQNDESYNDATLSTKEYMEFSKEARRSQHINTYVNNSADISTRINVTPQPLS